MAEPNKHLEVRFYIAKSGREPVRDWLRELDNADKKTIGEDIATLQYSWPIGKPKCAPIVGRRGLYEIRSSISSGRIARILFVLRGSKLVLLHAFIKKSRKTPPKEIAIGVSRQNEIEDNDD